MPHIDVSRSGAVPLYAVNAKRLPVLVWLLLSLVSTNNLAQAQTSGDASASEPVAVGEQAPLVVSYEDYNDPLEPVNRVMFRFNDYVYRYALIPAAKGYTKAVPGGVRQSIA